MAKAHGKDKEFGCKLCSKKFVYNYQLKTHLLTHNQTKNKSKEMSRLTQEAAGSMQDRTTFLISNVESGNFNDQDVATLADDESCIQTLYQCSLCQQVYQTYQGLQKHCAQHATATQSPLAASGLKELKAPPVDAIAVVADGNNAQIAGTGVGDNMMMIRSDQSSSEFTLLEVSSTLSAEQNSISRPSASNISGHLSSGNNQATAATLGSLEGSIIKEQDGQQYYVVYDAPASSQPIINIKR